MPSIGLNSRLAAVEEAPTSYSPFRARPQLTDSITIYPRALFAGKKLLNGGDGLLPRLTMDEKLN